MPVKAASRLFLRTNSLLRTPKNFVPGTFGGWLHSNGLWYFPRIMNAPDSGLRWSLTNKDPSKYRNLPSQAFAQGWVEQLYFQTQGGKFKFSRSSNAFRIVRFRASAEAITTYQTREGTDIMAKWLHIMFGDRRIYWEFSLMVPSDPKLGPIQYIPQYTKRFTNFQLLRQQWDSIIFAY